MSDWDRDEEYLSGPAATSLPTPQDTPYRTPSGNSRMSRRSITPPPKGPSPTHDDRKDRHSKRTSKDITTDESVSILDPRRFTPTLHANLVSEILTLRRDQEEKNKLIESLENTLSTTSQKQEDAQKDLTVTSKENRSLKRQLALLEGGTSSALGELARERDEAVESSADIKKRLEAAQKKIRTQEDDSQRVHDLWAREKDGWEEERRKFDRKLHVAESRLKVVLDEVAAFQAAQAEGGVPAQLPNAGHESDVEESGRENDGNSVRSMSMTNSIRFSMMHAGGLPTKDSGNTLADELDLDDDDDQTDWDGRESTFSGHTSHGHARTFSRDSVLSGRRHVRNQSIESLKRAGSRARGKLFMNESVLEALEGEDEEVATREKPTYTDTGVQFTPPPSPPLAAVRPATPEPAIPAAKTAQTDIPSPRADSEIEANQRRKRVQLIAQPPVVQAEQPPPPPPPKVMVSVGSQTAEEPPSPPGTPEEEERPQTPPPTMATSSTQTEISTPSPPPPPPVLNLPPAPTTPPPPPPLPTISIQPPSSRPTTPRGPRLPPLFKHIGCQVNISVPSSSSTSDAAIQTEGIKVDTRLAQLPPHLRPSAITSRPSSPVPAVDLDKNFTPVPAPGPRNPRRLLGTPESVRASSAQPSSAVQTRIEEDELHDSYPGNNDDGPLSDDKTGPKRPHRFSSLFAGFDTASSDEAEFGDEDNSDTEYRTALSAPRHQSSRQETRSPTEPTSPEQPMTRRQSARSTVKPISTQVYSSFSLSENKENQPAKSAPPYHSRDYDRSSISLGFGNRASVMRKAAVIQNGIANHGVGRPRSPSLPDTRNPPFPIPQRASSRKPSASAPTSEGQRSPTRMDGWRRNNARTSVYHTNSLRKVRSAAALPRHQSQRHRRHGSRSPPPLSPSTEAPESPGLPPLPRNDITTPRQRRRGNSHYRRHRPQPSNTTDHTANTANTVNTNMTLNTNATDPVSLASGNQSITVVDAIAQSMVGEWMYKYVRRRKSFNVAETSGKDDTGNDRHKRWVWLAPYERSILWSSKQPSSGSALMGKTGRKLAIQSVLDVKDDNPAPKGEAGSIFNRSILILTPQRALKFTATSAERHYVWLTALSFLAHSSQAVPEIVPSARPQPKQPPAAIENEAPPGKSKRPGIRDSIRLAKGRSGPLRSATPSIPSIPSAPSSQMGDVAGFRSAEYSMGTISSSHARDHSGDAAEPPMIPRFQDRASQAMIHGRKRSNTGGHVPPPLSFRGFSGPTSSASGHNATNSTAGTSVGTAGSSDYYQSQSQSQGSGWALSQTGSQRTSEASSRPGNFFDAIGTVRMEAFISPLGPSQFSDYPDEQDEYRHVARRRSKELRRRQSRRNSRTREVYGYPTRGRRGSDDGRMAAGEEDYFKDDPFRGF